MTACLPCLSHRRLVAYGSLFRGTAARITSHMRTERVIVRVDSMQGLRIFRQIWHALLSVVFFWCCPGGVLIFLVAM